jgi:hypothetical protein
VEVALFVGRPSFFFSRYCFWYSLFLANHFSLWSGVSCSFLDFCLLLSDVWMLRHRGPGGGLWVFDATSWYAVVGGYATFAGRELFIIVWWKLK